MKTILIAAALVIGFAGAGPARAELPLGAPAPDFTIEAALAGKPFQFSLQQALQQGPVVLYFYPAAFTKGCTLEAHAFADAMDEYQELGASVIGVSGDDIETLKEFSVGACGSRFAVGADTTGKVIRAYEAELASRRGRAARISYVLSPQGEVIYTYNAMNPDNHVGNTLEALRRWKDSHTGRLPGR